MKISFETKPGKADTLVFVVPAGGTGAAAGKALGDALKKAARAEGFTGKVAETLALSAPAGAAQDRVILLGAGKPEDLTLLDCEKMGGALVSCLNARRAGAAAVVFDLPGLKNLAPGEAAARLAAGALLNSYRFDKYRTKEPEEKKPTLKSLRFALSAAAPAQRIFEGVRRQARSVFLTRDLVSEAPNVLYPDSFARIIGREMAGLKVSVKTLDDRQMKKMGMGALIAVGQGSARPPRLVTMEYRGGRKGDRPVAFVGKGVTFDTGGISLKPGPGMEEMKWDMAGAAVVAGLMQALAARKAKVNAVGVVALAENMPSGNACRPGDIVKTLSGQTVEIHNTDAEGRLILCDALWYCQEKFRPARIVDLATLTGAMIVALGHEYAGVFCNDDGLAEGLLRAGKDTGEALWRMPFADAWDKALDTPAADMKNIGGRDAGSATAAHFLKRFIQKDVKWAHIDIAGMAWAYRDRTAAPKGASGFGVRLLDRFVADCCEGATARTPAS